jgi:uncharacterized protein (TIGR00369 family)
VSSQIFGRSPFGRFLGWRAEIADGVLTAVLPFDDKLIGNVKWQAMHGGVLGAFMELTALAQLDLSEAAAAKPIDVTIEYLRIGRPLTTFARAELIKVGRRVANVRVAAWQDDPAQPITTLRGHFLLERR